MSAPTLSSRTTLWARVRQRLTGQTPVRRTKPVAALRRPQPTEAPREMWVVDDRMQQRRDAAPLAWDGSPVEYAPASTDLTVPDGLVNQARVMIAERTGIFVPTVAVRPLLIGELGRRLVTLGHLDAPLRADILDALGQQLVKQKFPAPEAVERHKAYRVGLVLAARSAGYEVFDAF